MYDNNNNFAFQDTDPEGVPLKHSRKMSTGGFFRDLITLIILVLVGYTLFFSYYTYSDYKKMKANVENAAIWASKSSDDNKIKKTLSSYCVISEHYWCTPEDIAIERDFKNATVNIKFKYMFKVLNRWPIVLVFNPTVKERIE